MNNLDSDGLKQRFIASLEDYYRDEYPGTMKKKVLEMLPSKEEKLTALYNIAIRDKEAWKRSVKVPGAAEIDSYLQELYEAYPEFSARALPSGDYLQIEEDAGFDVEPLFEQLRAALRRNKSKIS
ncbi:MAG: hypothetical protein LAT56_00385 [Wenzhouxiangella sp.]|nr:hypothetical protein [Wenzhouxiangella sp.]